MLYREIIAICSQIHTKHTNVEVYSFQMLSKLADTNTVKRLLYNNHGEELRPGSLTLYNADQFAQFKVTYLFSLKGRSRSRWMKRPAHTVRDTQLCRETDSADTAVSCSWALRRLYTLYF